MDKTMLMIGYLHSKYDKRVFRTVKVLARNCHVYYQYWTNNLDEQEEVSGNIHYIPLFCDKGVKQGALSKIKKRRVLEKGILELVKFMDYDAVYFHSALRLAPLKPFKIARQRNKTVVYDMHEHYPCEVFSNLRGWKRKLKEKIYWKIMKQQIELSDRVVFVSKDIEQDVFLTTGVRKPSMIVSNWGSQTIPCVDKDKEIVIVGGTSRNMEAEIPLLRELQKNGWKVKIVGMPKKDSALGKSDLDIQYLKFLPYQQMMNILAKASFSMVSYEKDSLGNKNYLFSAPNKFFDSLCASTPVITNQIYVTMSNIIDRTGCGLIVDIHDPKKSTMLIDKSYENYKLMQNRLKEHLSEFVWDETKEENFRNFIISSLI